MTLTQLRYIIAIADTGSMNEAAKSLFISQPSLSLAVKELEKEIGTRLFKRSNRGVSVTQEGMEFLSYARERLGCEINRLFAASFIDPVSAIAIIYLNCVNVMVLPFLIF